MRCGKGRPARRSPAPPGAAPATAARSRPEEGDAPPAFDPYAALDREGTSTMITRMTSDVNQVQNGVNLTLRLTAIVLLITL